jgi:hypothetical protein
MPHPLVLQLRFTRSEFLRGLDGLSEADAIRRVGRMNSISWNVGHLAWQEQRYWLWRLQDQLPWPDLQEKFCFGCPAITPPLAEMLAAWRAVTQAADPFLDTLTTADLLAEHPLDTPGSFFTAGNLMQRVIYHYWYHNGENQAIRQALDHSDLTVFVGNIDDEAPFVRGYDDYRG